MRLIFILVIGLCTIYQNCAQSISFGAGPTFPIYYSPNEFGQFHSESEGRLGYAFNLTYINPKGKQLGTSFEKISFIKINLSDAPGPFPGSTILRTNHSTYFINFYFLPFQVDLIKKGRLQSLINLGFNLDFTLDNDRENADRECYQRYDNDYNNYSFRPGFSLITNFEIKYNINEKTSLFFAPITKLALIDKICDDGLGPLNFNYQFIFGCNKSLNNAD
jgi:hypothetical protein